MLAPRAALALLSDHLQEPAGIDYSPQDIVTSNEDDVSSICLIHNTSAFVGFDAAQTFIGKAGSPCKPCILAQMQVAW